RVEIRGPFEITGDVDFTTGIGGDGFHHLVAGPTDTRCPLKCTGLAVAHDKSVFGIRRIAWNAKKGAEIAVEGANDQKVAARSDGDGERLFIAWRCELNRPLPQRDLRKCPKAP